MRIFAVLAIAGSTFVGGHILTLPAAADSSMTPDAHASTAPADAAPWAEFVVPGADFSIALPGRPRARAAVGTRPTMPSMTEWPSASVTKCGLAKPSRKS